MLLELTKGWDDKEKEGKIVSVFFSEYKIFPIVVDDLVL